MLSVIESYGIFSC